MRTYSFFHLGAYIVANAICVIVIFSGCALTTNGTTQLVHLSASDGKRVVAIVDGKEVVLPAKVEVKRKGIEVFVFHADNPNYQDSFIAFKPDGMSSGYYLDFISSLGIGGSTSMSVDESTGSAYKYSNDSLIVPVYPASIYKQQ